MFLKTEGSVCRYSFGRVALKLGRGLYDDVYGTRDPIMGFKPTVSPPALVIVRRWRRRHNLSPWLRPNGSMPVMYLFIRAQPYKDR